MFARVSRSRIQLDKLDEAIKNTKESIIPAAKSQKGFRGIYALRDRKTGKSITISLWETEEDAIATNERSSYLQGQIAKTTPYRAEEPVIELYEVVAQG